MTGFHARQRHMRLAMLASLVGFVLVATLAIGQDGTSPNDRIYFSKSFPKSVPAYYEVEVARSGKVTYREAPGEEVPVEFELVADETAKVFELAESLDRFRMTLNLNRKVAFTGDKVFRFEPGAGERSEAKFVYTENPEALKLLEWFEKVGETERHLIELERVAQFDHLGVNKRLLQFQISLEKDRIVSPAQFLPILEKIAAQKKIVQLARSRAAGLAERIGRSSGGS
jgi:hypothetical protein